MNKVKTYYKNPLSYFEIASFLKDYIKDAIIVCIGTDKCIGDCLGPLIGTSLKEHNLPIPVYGTLEFPIHALNITTEIAKIKNSHPNSLIIAIDACLGDSSAIGELFVRNESLKPGKGVGKTLPSVGDFSIIGIVDSSSKTDLFSNRAIRLNLIMDISKVLTNAILTSYILYTDTLKK